MINYIELISKPTKFNATVKKEISYIENSISSQLELKEKIKKYNEDINTTFENNEVFKNMLLSSIEAASLQIEINSKDLENLNKILGLITQENESLEADIEQYNTLLSKTEKNIILVNEILEKVDNSYTQLSKITTGSISNKENTSEKAEKVKSKSPATKSKENNEERPQILFEKRNDEDSPINLRKIEDNKNSDLLCFFPKSNSDILAISTIQSTYKVLFNKENATVFIEEENFNFTLKTIGVQISNNSNVLLVSRKSGGFFIVTNMMIDVPAHINVSKINRNKTFIEITITNPEINVAVDENHITFPKHNKALGAISKTSEVLKQDPDIFEEPEEPTAPTIEESLSKEEKKLNDEKNLQDVKDYNEDTRNREIDERPQRRDDRDFDDRPQRRDDRDFDDRPLKRDNRDFDDRPYRRDDRDFDDRPRRNDRDFDDRPKRRDDRDFDDDRYRRDNRRNPNDSYSDMNLLEDNDSLIISERDNQVILPYTIDEVEKEYKKSKKKYSSVEDLIKNEYIVSATNFKNPIRSRFREAYQLIKKREHGHLKEAIDLGFELMFESKLNPAVIAACKSLRELDIYLDCLDDNELDKFSCFNIVYNVPPSKSSGKSKGKHNK